MWINANDNFEDSEPHFSLGEIGFLIKEKNEQYPYGQDFRLTREPQDDSAWNGGEKRHAFVQGVAGWINNVKYEAIGVATVTKVIERSDVQDPRQRIRVRVLRGRKEVEALTKLGYRRDGRFAVHAR